ncbi:MAG: hypothetical protein ACR2QH_16935, partial [Geminicoccaceae bacterium]
HQESGTIAPTGVQGKDASPTGSIGAVNIRDNWYWSPLDRLSNDFMVLPMISGAVPAKLTSEKRKKQKKSHHCEVTHSELAEMGL